MTFEAGQVLSTRYGVLSELDLPDDAQVLYVLPNQPSTQKVREMNDYLNDAVEEGDISSGDEIVTIKVNSHRKLKVAVVLGSLQPRKKKTGKDEEPSDGDEL